MCSRTSCIETVVQVAGGVEAINSVFDALGYELAARDGCRPGDIEHRSKAILGGVFTPVGEHVDVVGNIGDEVPGMNYRRRVLMPWITALPAASREVGARTAQSAPGDAP